MTATSGTLRYLDAESVLVSGRPAGGLRMRAANHQLLGLVQGILVEPASRRARYYVVGRGLFRRHRWLVPTDRFATLDAGTGTIYIDVTRADIVDGFEESRIPRFSDDDLVRTLFSPAA